MSPSSPQFVLSLAFLVLSSFAYFFIGKMNYRSANKEKYSTKNMFLYELNFNVNGKYNVIWQISFYAFIVAQALPLVFFITNYIYYPSSFSFACVVAFVSLVNILTFICLSTLPAKYVKPHIIFDTIYFALTFIESGMLSIFIIATYKNYDVFHLVIGILIGLISVISLIISINPKLKSWAELESVRNEDGTATVIRPKWFVLAASEWIMLLMNVIFILLLTLSLLSI